MPQVRYSFDQLLRFSGTIELSQEEFEKLDKLSDDKLAEELSELVNLDEPTDWETKDCDEFTIIEEE